jgi:hypothetical protein
VSHTGTTTTLSLYGIDTATFSNSGTIGTLYGLRLPTITNTGTITTRYGISQEDTAAINQFAGTVQYNNGFGSVATVYGTRAWVNFNGTGVLAIRASGNVSSVSDVGVGTYTVNMTTAMPDANYSAVACTQWAGGPYVIGHLNTQTASAFPFSTGTTIGGPVDIAIVMVTITR